MRTSVRIIRKCNYKYDKMIRTLEKVLPSRTSKQRREKKRIEMHIIRFDEDSKFNAFKSKIH